MGLSKEDIGSFKDSLESNEVAIEVRATVCTGEEFGFFCVATLPNTDEKISIMARNLRVALFNRFHPDSEFPFKDKFVKYE